MLSKYFTPTIKLTLGFIVVNLFTYIKLDATILITKTTKVTLLIKWLSHFILYKLTNPIPANTDTNMLSKGINSKYLIDKKIRIGNDKYRKILTCFLK